MRQLLIATFLLSVVNTTSLSGEDPEFPKTMLAFIKPGMNIGIRSVEGSASVSLSTYGEERFSIAKKIAGLGRSARSAKEFAAGDDVIQAELDAFTAKLEPETDASYDVRVMPLLRTSLGSVLAVGEDYILVELEGDEKRRRVVPKTAIGTIYLDANPLRFYGDPRRIRTLPGR